MARAVAVTITRSSAMRLSRRLAQVERGAALLRRKRDALVIEVFAKARPAIDAREAIEEQAQFAYAALLDALGSTGRSGLAPLGWPSRELRVELGSGEDGTRDAARAAQNTIRLRRETLARGLLPGHADAAADKAAERFERLVELVLASAREELTIRRLARVLAHTVRQVNVLEQQVSVDLVRTLRCVRRALDEREREDSTRLRHIALRVRR